MGQINICITVDWEGESLADLDDLINIRNKLDEEIPFTHFICPNYFLKGSDTKLTSEMIKNAIKPSDEVGLHIHCHRDLINHIPEVEFRTEENYHNIPGWIEKNIVKKIFPKYQRHISGRGVPLSVYDEKEIEKIIRTSRDLLSKNLYLDDIRGFRAGGWIANDTVLDIIEKLNFEYDSSAVPPSILSRDYNKESEGNKQDDYGDKNGVFTEHILKLWGYKKQIQGFLKNENILHYNKNEAISIYSQAFKYNNLVEIPNNCGLTDFCSSHDTVIPLVKHYLKELEKNPENDFLIVYGCHQEGDAFYKKALLEFISEIYKMDTSFFKFIRMKDVTMEK